MKERYVDWEEFGIMMDKLVQQIKDSGETFDGVYGIPRGGLAIALTLSHYLDLPLLKIPTLNTLIVDDISDIGETLKKYKDNKIATLFSTDWTITKPDWFIDKKLNKDEWIVFSWEKNMEERQTTLNEFI